MDHSIQTKTIFQGEVMKNHELQLENDELREDLGEAHADIDDLNDKLMQTTGVIAYLEFSLEDVKQQNRDLQKTASALDKLRREKVTPISALKKRSSKDVLEEAIANAKNRGGKHE
jgi:regulator of replication initiation timing